EVPDADAFTFDIALPASTVAGLVVDRETEQPLPRANVTAMPSTPDRTPRAGMAMSATATTGGDGRFRLDLEPGEYKLMARAQGYTGEPVTVTVAWSGGNEVRLPPSRGNSIRGRVVDARGQGVAGLSVTAFAIEGEVSRLGGATMSLGDGSFEIGGLGSGDYSLMSQSGLGLFALRPPVAARTHDRPPPPPPPA